MSTINITNARANLYQLVSDVNVGFNPITIVNNKLRCFLMQKSGNFYVIKFSKMALKDKVKLKNSGLDKTAKNILLLMSSDPFCYPPSYEKLYGNLRGLYSRRINRQHRIVYEVDEVNKEIHIIRMWTHYDDV